MSQIIKALNDQTSKKLALYLEIFYIRLYTANNELPSFDVSLNVNRLQENIE